ncbi:DUF6493 family protein [Actinopolymorpha alba]|uniref:DUF6493 family protein n=1 Tax=Actinopolymorpha alba TaxID=533267 RepID=UPI000379728C|nr:DUF6493 family protein [Actinopolymorpha alba]
MTLAEQVIDAVRRDDGATVVSLLAGRTEKERAAVARAVKEYYRRPLFYLERANAPFALAVLGAVSRATQVSRLLDWSGLSDVSVTMAVRVLTDRNPAWIADLPAALLNARRHGGGWWRLVRQLVRQGVVSAPDEPNYTLHMVRNLGRQSRSDQESSLANRLAEDPALLEDEVPRLFRVEGAGPHLHGHDYYAKGDDELWAACLIDALPRQKAIDLALSALQQDWPAHDVTWYVDFHRRLQPTVEEMTSRQNTYRALLSATASTVVKLAQDALRQLLAAQRLDIHAFLDIADAPLHRTEKSLGLTQIALLHAVTDAEPHHAPTCARAVIAGLTHPHQAVQQAAAEAVLAMKADSDPRVATEVRSCLPALGGRAADILVPVFTDSESESSAAFVQVPGPRRTPLTVQPQEMARLDPDMIEPALVHLLEDATDPLLIEQVLDFVATNADRRPTSEALLDQAQTLLYWCRAFRGTDVGVDLAQVVVSWMTGREPEETVRLDAVPHFDGRTFGSRPDENVPAILSLGTIVSSRLRELAVVAAHGHPRTLLAAPTYINATISTADLRARLDELARARHDLLPMDLETAVLRAGPAVMSELLANQPSADVGLVRVTTDMTRTPTWQRQAGQPRGSSNFLAGIVGRYDLRPRVVVWRDTSAPTGSPDRIITSLLDLQEPLSRAGYRWDDSDIVRSPRHHQLVACWPLVAPHHPDVVMAQAHPMLCRQVWEVRDAAVPLVQSLATLTIPPGEPTWSALSLALSGKNPTLRTAAVDAVVGLVSTNLLDGAALGRVSAQHAADKMIIVQRLLRSLEEAANANAACTWRVFDTLEALLPGLVGHRDLGRALLLTDELAQRCGRTAVLPNYPSVSSAAAETIERLAQRTQTGTTTRAEAARLLADTAL